MWPSFAKRKTSDTMVPLSFQSVKRKAQTQIMGSEVHEKAKVRMS
jgi:hypothetical protein